ncbi:hypothetical protein MXD81_23715, partial [Microbacteriaceae bacterium K1510]|nr:hypothetical protein [Microbacteriaceae bacterium K1510]
MSIKKSGGVVEEIKTIGAPSVVAAPPAVSAVSAPVAETLAAPVQAEPAPKVAAVEPGVGESKLHKIVSPMVGTFYSSPEPGTPAYVQVGDKVTSNRVVCIVEAMKLFNEIEAEVTG